MKKLRTVDGMAITRALFIGAGSMVMGYGVLGAFTDPDFKLGGVALFAVVVLAAHDGVFLPLVLGAGALLGGCHRLIRAALIVSLAVTVVAVPFVLGYGRSPDNPSALPLAYGRGLAAVLLAVWLATFLLLAVQRRGNRAMRLRGNSGADGPQAANRQKIVRTQTSHPGPSDG